MALVGENKDQDTQVNVRNLKNCCVKATERLNLKTIITFLGLRRLWKEELEDPFSTGFQEKGHNFWAK